MFELSVICKTIRQFETESWKKSTSKQTLHLEQQNQSELVKLLTRIF